jgi:excisionase family DNA binding protein
LPAVAKEQPRDLFGTEAALYARVHPSTLYRWIKQGRVRATKLGGRWYVCRDDLDKLLAGDLP